MMRRGSVLVEIIVAVAVVTASVVALFGAIQLSYRAVIKAAEKHQVAFFLEEGIEAVRHVRDESWLNKVAPLSLAPAAYCIDPDTSRYVLSNTQGQVLLMHMNGSGVTHGSTIEDSSGKNHPGTYQANVSDPDTNKTTVASTTASGFGNAVEFDGVDDYITVPGHADFNLTSFTLEAWVKTPPAGAGSGRRRIINRPDGALFWAMSLNNNVLEWGLIFDSPVFGTCGNSTPIIPDVWHHLAIVRAAGSNISCYQDGVQVGSPQAASATPYNFAVTRPVEIGRLNAVDYIRAEIDEVAVYNRALSAAEIADRWAVGAICRKLDNRYERRVKFSNVCRKNAAPSQDSIIGSTLASSGSCTIHGSLGYVDVDTKLATTTVSWGTFSESIEFYVSNLFNN